MDQDFVISLSLGSDMQSLTGLFYVSIRDVFANATRRLGDSVVSSTA